MLVTRAGAALKMLLSLTGPKPSRLLSSLASTPPLIAPGKGAALVTPGRIVAVTPTPIVGGVIMSRGASVACRSGTQKQIAWPTASSQVVISARKVTLESPFAPPFATETDSPGAGVLAPAQAVRRSRLAGLTVWLKDAPLSVNVMSATLPMAMPVPVPGISLVPSFMVAATASDT